jgi:3-dehydroquinate synthase
LTEPFRSIRHGAKTCEVFVGRGLARRLGELTAEWQVRYAIIGDGFLRHHEELLEDLGKHGIETIVIRDGEPAKTLAGVEAIVTELLARGARRDATIIAIGGGVTGDLAGFAAAVFLRGVRLVHVPTTLLAQVDSSIGGKTAVNHAMGKNLVGAFHPAARVIADVSLLSTLPRAELLSGLFEALKSGVIGDAALFETCVESRDEILAAKPEPLDEIVRRSITVKAGIVEQDERDGGVRRLLNYGHTIGHGIEAALGFVGLTHGEAVAWGMIGANAIAAERGMLDVATSERIRATILGFGPARPGALDPDDVYAAVRHDKKFSSSGMVMVLPTAIGRCEVVEGITENEIRSGIGTVLALAGDES